MNRRVTIRRRALHPLMLALLATAVGVGCALFAFAFDSLAEWSLYAKGSDRFTAYRIGIALWCAWMLWPWIPLAMLAQRLHHWALPIGYGMVAAFIDWLTSVWVIPWPDEDGYAVTSPLGQMVWFAVLGVVVWAAARWLFLLFFVVQDGTRCPGCGYSLIGNVTGVCPECGRAFSFAELGTTEEKLRALGQAGDRAKE